MPLITPLNGATSLAAPSDADDAYAGPRLPLVTPSSAQAWQLSRATSASAGRWNDMLPGSVSGGTKEPTSSSPPLSYHGDTLSVVASSSDDESVRGSRHSDQSVHYDDSDCSDGESDQEEDDASVAVHDQWESDDDDEVGRGVGGILDAGLSDSDCTDGMSDSDDDLSYSDDEFHRFKIKDNSGDIAAARGRRKRYALPVVDIPSTLRRDLRRFKKHLTEPVWVARGASASITEGTYHKLNERLRGLFGYLVEVTNGAALDGDVRFEALMFNHRHMFLAYIRYLQDQRMLQAGTICQHASMIVTVTKYFVATTKIEERRLEFAKLVTTWKAFRNRINSIHIRTIRSKDLDSERNHGALVPTWQEYGMIAAHIYRRVDLAVSTGIEEHTRVMDALQIFLLFCLPAMRSGMLIQLQAFLFKKFDPDMLHSTHVMHVSEVTASIWVYIC